MTPNSICTTPRIDVDDRLSLPNIYHANFGDLSADEWLNILVRSIDESSINGVQFPSFPSAEFQSQIHGHFGEHSLREATDFYRFLIDNNLTGPQSQWYGKGYLLDFGPGWGLSLIHI